MTDKSVIKNKMIYLGFTGQCLEWKKCQLCTIYELLIKYSINIGMKVGDGPVQLIKGIAKYFKENSDHFFYQNEVRFMDFKP